MNNRLPDLSDDAMRELLRNDAWFRGAYYGARSLEKNPTTDTERLNRAARMLAVIAYREQEAISQQTEIRGLMHRTVARNDNTSM